MKIEETFIDDLFIIQPLIFNDDRGYFFESYNKNKLHDFIAVDFVQGNESLSQKNVLRGLHFQIPPYAQDKLVRVINGSVLDVAVDLRKGKSTYGKYFAIVLSADNKKQLFIPKGFAHGFLTLEDNTIFSYKCSNFYHKKSELSINCFDKDLNINWNIENEILSEKDKNGIKFSKFDTPFH